ncbi:hypothetical protein BLNAU_2370 [Blattamonas nauphoetae]|uniref:Tetratricopeptide repeat protein n=1 Tax=Blattamonas nauphoetae TaxID=2049346 RepID=A0ABQ9YFJ3_9EUKA|nr:hypothetical protein BLNAU_2370 [Blattamonas nauphoetae]
MLNAYIQEAIDNYSFENALFYAEMNHAQLNSVESRFLLTEVFLRAGQPQHALVVMDQHFDDSFACMYARACLQTGQYSRGITKLSHLLTSSDIHPQVADPHVLFVLGKLYKQSAQFNMATNCFRICISLDSQYFAAFDQLLELGVPIQSETIPLHTNLSFTQPSDTNTSQLLPVQPVLESIASARH